MHLVLQEERFYPQAKLNHSMIMKTLVSSLFALVVAASANAAVSGNDKSFIEKAAKSGTQEVAISAAALDHLSNAEVKRFAQMMVADHEKANAELMTLAANKGVTLPPKDKLATGITEKWSNKTKDVDSDYVQQMVEDHEDAVNLFEKATKSDDAEISAFAAKTLPTLQHHLEMTRGLKKSVKH